MRKNGFKVYFLTLIMFVALLSAQAQSVFKTSGGDCVGDNMVFAFGGPTCTVSWVVNTGTSYTIISSSNTQLTVKFNSPVGNNAVSITANYHTCSNGASGGVNSPSFSVNGLTSGGSIGSNQTICYLGDPAAFTNVVTAGGVGYATQWQQSTNGGSTWTNISGATGLTYNAPSLTVTTQFRRRVTVCGQTMYSNVVTVTVHPDLNPGSISGSQSICYNGNPSAFTNTGSASGGTGSYAYQWQKSTNGGSTWTDISGATGLTYDPPALTGTTLYRRRVISCQTKYSNVLTVTINLPTTPDVNNEPRDHDSFNAEWDPSPCAVWYVVEISKDGDWNNSNDCSDNPSDPYRTQATDYTFQSAMFNTNLCSESLQDGEIYYWQVRACVDPFNSSTCSGWNGDTVLLGNANRLSVNKPNDLLLNRVSFFPNPTSGELFMLANEGVERFDLTYRIFDHTGRVVQIGSFSSNQSLNLSKLKNGLYFMEYEALGQRKVQQILKE